MDVFFYDCCCSCFLFYRDVEAEPEPTTEAVAKPDSPVVGRESTLSSVTTVSEPDTSENTEPVPREDIVDLNPEPLQEPGQESPPPSPYVLRNRKLSVESEESFYDQPYSSLEEINAGATPSELLGTSSPQATESAVNGAETDVALENQDSPSSTADLASLLTAQPYGTMDKEDEEADVMEVKDIETQNTAKDFDEVPDDLLLENPPAEPAQIPNTFLRSDDVDSTLLIF